MNKPVLSKDRIAQIANDISECCDKSTKEELRECVKYFQMRSIESEEQTRCVTMEVLTFALKLLEKNKA